MIVQRAPAMRLDLTLEATTTLLMHNVQLGDPDNEYTRSIAKLNALKSKITDEQRAERDYLKWRGGLYYDDEVGPFLPGANLFRSIQQAASLTSNGKDIERGLNVLTDVAPLQYPGPRDIPGMWNNGTGRFVDRRMAKRRRGSRSTGLASRWNMPAMVCNDICEATSPSG